MTSDALREPKNVYNVIALMKRFPVMFSAGTLKDIECQLAGYVAAIGDMGLWERDVPPFALFLDWLALTQKGTWHRGWANTLLSQSKYDNERALKKFFVLVERFGSFRQVTRMSIDIPVGQKRSEPYLEWSAKPKDSPVPDRLEVVQLQPSETCYLRHWFADRRRDEPPLFPNLDTLLASVEYEFGISPAERPENATRSELSRVATKPSAKRTRNKKPKPKAYY